MQSSCVPEVQHKFLTPPFKGVSAVKMNLMFQLVFPIPWSHLDIATNTQTSHPDGNRDIFKWYAEFQVKRRRYDARAEACSDD